MSAQHPVPETLDAYRRVIAALACEIEPDDLSRVMDRLRIEGERASSATVIPLRGNWQRGDDRQAYGRCLLDVVEKLTVRAGVGAT